MQAFDFDNTIYKGESAFDFALFVLKKRKRLLRYLPGIVKILLDYKACRMSSDEYLVRINKYAPIFLENKEFIQKLVVEFWKKNEHKLYLHILEKITPEDFIITSSPYFLLEPIMEKLNTTHFICSEANLDEGKMTYLNFKENKVKKFVEKIGKKKITNFYTDSYNDKPMMDYAEHVFLITKGKIEKIK